MTTRRTRLAGCCTDLNDPAPLVIASVEPATAEERLVAGFRALGDPTRFAILRLIAAQREPVCVCDVTARFDVSQPTISHHLRILREAGLVRVSRRGVWAYYEVDRAGLALLRDGLRTLAAPEEIESLQDAEPAKVLAAVG